MSKSKLNFIIDAIMFVLMGLVAGLGLLIKYVLLPGSERWLKYGRNVDISFWGLDRHDWGKVHLIVALILILFLILHIIFHWELIKCLYKRIFAEKSVRILFGIFFLIITLILIWFPFFIHVEVQDQASGFEKYKNKTEVYSVNKENINPEKRNLVKQNIGNKKDSEHKTNNTHAEHHNVDSGIEIKGFMTLSKVSEKYDIPCSYLKQKLKLPSETPNTSQLGHLRKKHGFKMSEIETIIYSYKTTGK